jgi:hypothetical protein
MRWQILVLSLIPTWSMAGPMDDLMVQAAADCAAIGGTQFLPGDSVTEVDLTGDGLPETLVDAGAFICEGAMSAFSGTGGAPLTVFVGSLQADFLTKGWQVIPTAPGPVLLMQVHGSNCGGIGADPCFQAVVWNGQQFMSMQPLE